MKKRGSGSEYITEEGKLRDKMNVTFSEEDAAWVKEEIEIFETEAAVIRRAIRAHRLVAEVAQEVYIAGGKIAGKSTDGMSADDTAARWVSLVDNETKAKLLDGLIAASPSSAIDA